MKRLGQILVIFITLLLLIPMWADHARTADYPGKTIHIVVPWKAGGGTDAIGRGFAEAMKTVVDVSVVVDNISGAGGFIH